MGGSTKNTGDSDSRRRKRLGGDGGQPDDRCPIKFRAVITGPAAGIMPGTWLDLVLDQTSAPPRVVFTDVASGAIVGSLAAVPNLDVLIECLRSQVEYRAHVESVDGGKVDVTVIRQ